MLLATFAALAIVTQDQAALRAAPQRTAQQQATLWQGDTLEVRGEHLDYLQVYDHRRERAGYVLASQARIVALEAAAAPGLLAVLEFLRDAPGSEALGIAYAAAYLKAAPVEAISAEPLVALGLMADRLAARASARSGRASDAKLAAHLDVVAGYGVRFASFERDGRVQLCYDGDALRRALALPASARQQAEAMLALTRHECLDPAQSPLERRAVDQWRAEALERVDARALPPLLKNRIRIRRAGVWAGLAFAHTRGGESGQEAGSRALQELAAVVESELTVEDRAAYTEAAVRVGASRWAAEDDATPRGALRIATQAGAPGETCVLLLDGAHTETSPLLRRCTYGTVWRASASANRAGTALALAVQPLEAWREVWVFRKAKAPVGAAHGREAKALVGAAHGREAKALVGAAHGREAWSVDILPPAASGPDLGYAEFAGWVPGKAQLLVAREARVQDRWQRSFEIVSLDTLAVLRRAGEPDHLSAFYRWQSPAWKQLTVSLR